MDEAADRNAIRELLFKYALMVDKNEWGMQDAIFHEEATIDYASAGKGGSIGPYKEMLHWLKESLKHSPVRYHFISNEIISIDGDDADCTCAFNSPMVLEEPGAPKLTMTNSGYYHDRLVRTPKGWRIRTRIVDMGLQIFHK